MDTDTTSTELWEHQRQAVAFITRNSVALLHMEMGTGKTRCVLDLVRRHPSIRRTLVVAPKSVVPVWPAEMERFLGRDSGIRAVAITGSAARKRKLLNGALRHAACQPVVIVIGYESSFRSPVSETLLGETWDLVVLDESHKIKSPTGITSRFVSSLAADRKLCLTGTPMPHSPLDIWAQMRFLDPTVLGWSFTRFRARHAEMGIRIDPAWPANWRSTLEAMPPNRRAVCAQLLETKKFRSAYRESLQRQLKDWLDGHGRRSYDSPFSDRQWQTLAAVKTQHLYRITGWRRLDELQAQIAPYIYQCRAEDVLDLPAKHHVDHPVELEPGARKIYDRMERELVADLEAGEVTATNALDRLLKLQQITSGHLWVETEAAENGRQAERDVVRVSRAKQEALQEIFEDLPAEEPVVVVARFRPDVDAIHEAAAAAGRISGEISGRRNDISETGGVWRDDSPATVLAVNIQSGGLGIDLTRARYMVLYSVGFDGGAYQQCLARIHRPGQDRPVRYIHLVCRGTIDEKVYQTLRRRQDVVRAVLEGLRE